MVVNRVSRSMPYVGFSACGQAWNKPDDGAGMNGSQAYMAERRGVPRTTGLRAGDPDRANAGSCNAPRPPAMPIRAVGDDAMPLSLGDSVRLSLPGSEAPSGSYKVGTAGVLNLDVMGELRTTGMTIKQAKAELPHRPLATGCCRPSHARDVEAARPRRDPGAPFRRCVPSGPGSASTRNRRQTATCRMMPPAITPTTGHRAAPCPTPAACATMPEYSMWPSPSFGRACC